MEKETIKIEVLKQYAAYLRREEKSAATAEKYLRYTRAFLCFVGSGELTKEAVISYKEHVAQSYTAAGGNGVLSAVNSLLTFMGMDELKVKLFKVQRQLFIAPERELSRAEFDSLLDAAQRRDPRLNLVMQTMLATGIRVSELKFITVRAALDGRAEVRLKGKTRLIFLPTKLCQKLLFYIKERGIKEGPVFVTRGGLPLDRSNIWTQMKSLSREAGVSGNKVFPHNLRRLFARTYYEKIPNLVELADIMGHSDVNTTRIYTATSAERHRERLDMLKLVM